ncbi:MAG: tyrosine-type recombinase/integrase [Candidatus Cloacimonetes bacterium]|nr:tyrosine-type recombinase/integrase [Candidatus Cloacimonadota bacterium]
MAEINKNMLRPIAEKLYEITDQMWQSINKENRELVEEYIEINNQLSEKTKETYISALRQFFWFTYEKLNDKPFHTITKRDFMKYMSYLQERGLSSSAISLRKASVSSFCNYIENVVADDIPEYNNFRNFTRGMPPIPKNQVYNKVPITYEEYELLIKTLEESKDYLGLAWVATAFNVGARRAELIQFKTEILDYPIQDNQNFIISHVVRGKGTSVDGKPLRYMIHMDALKYMKLWVENRKYDSEYIFVTKYGGKVKPISNNWANRFCTDILSPILGKRVHPHMFKASCITYLLENGKDLKLVSKYIAHHEDTATTSGFYDLRDFEEEKNNIFV